MQTALLSKAFRISGLVGFRSRVPRPDIPDCIGLVLDGVSEGSLDADFPQNTEEPLLDEYEYQSDGDLADGPGRTAPPLSSTSEQDQIVQGCRLS